MLDGLSPCNRSGRLRTRRPAAGRRGRGQVPSGGGSAIEGQAAAVERSLLGRRRAAGDLASIKSFRGDGGGDGRDGPGRNAERSFHKEKRSNETHRSTTDPEARLYKKGDGQPAELYDLGHALMANRHGLVVGGGATLANGTAEREAAPALIDDTRRPRQRITLGADKAYDVMGSLATSRGRPVTPRIAANGHQTKTGKRRKTAIDCRTLRHAGDEISQRCRKRLEKVFGWIKSFAGLPKVKLRERSRGDAAYKLTRLPKLPASSA